MAKRKLIKKVSVSTIPKINGSVVDTFNVEDKTTNAPSIRAMLEKLSYSLQEQFIGYWIDGKPLYRKVISCGALPNNGPLKFSIEPNIKIIKIEGFSSSGQYTMPIPNPHGDSTKVVNIYVDYSYNQIGIETHSDRTSYTETYLTIEYTKTTD